MKEIRIIFHHLKKWLFEIKDGSACVFRTTLEAEQALKELGITKYDLADVGNGVYLADISAFAAPTSENFVLFDSTPTIFVSKAGKEAFDSVLTFIAACREKLASLLGQTVDVIVDRKIGTRHPKRPETVYPINYGYLENVLSADGEGADAYIMGVSVPIETFRGKVIAVVHREDDIEDKLVVAPENTHYSEQEIEDAILFQEIAYKHTLTVLE